MKLTDKQKTIIWKSLKLNEDFFDDNQSDIHDEPSLDLENEYDQQYTYHFQFLFFLWPLIKETDKKLQNPEYYFEDPKYKPIIESAFISMKKTLDCILLSSHIVTEYSEPKFCALNDKFISTFPFMNNEPEHQLFEDSNSNYYEEIFERTISLEMTLNLSDKKNRHNIGKLLSSFYKLKLIYNNLAKKFNTDIIDISPRLGYFRKNPLVKMAFIELVSPTDAAKRYTTSHLIDLLLTDYK